MPPKLSHKYVFLYIFGECACNPHKLFTNTSFQAGRKKFVTMVLLTPDVPKVSQKSLSLQSSCLSTFVTGNTYSGTCISLPN